MFKRIQEYKKSICVFLIYKPMEQAASAKKTSVETI